MFLNVIHCKFLFNMYKLRILDEDGSISINHWFQILTMHLTFKIYSKHIPKSEMNSFNWGNGRFSIMYNNILIL
jgi:hypothetical protein